MTVPSVGFKSGATSAWANLVADDVNALLATVGGTAMGFVATTETTTSATYADLATVGPLVTLETGTCVLMSFGATWQRIAGTGSLRMAVAVSGDTTIAAPAGRLYTGGTGEHSASGSLLTFGTHLVLTGLTPGENTFTIKYAGSVAGSTYQYANRWLRVERID
jgi:hypothetical protein